MVRQQPGFQLCAGKARRLPRREHLTQRVIHVARENHRHAAAFAGFQRRLQHPHLVSAAVHSVHPVQRQPHSQFRPNLPPARRIVWLRVFNKVHPLRPRTQRPQRGDARAIAVQAHAQTRLHRRAHALHHARICPMRLQFHRGESGGGQRGEVSVAGDRRMAAGNSAVGEKGASLPPRRAIFRRTRQRPLQQPVPPPAAQLRQQFFYRRITQLRPWMHAAKALVTTEEEALHHAAVRKRVRRPAAQREAIAVNVVRAHASAFQAGQREKQRPAQQVRGTQREDLIIAW